MPAFALQKCNMSISHKECCSGIIPARQNIGKCSFSLQRATHEIALSLVLDQGQQILQKGVDMLLAHPTTLGTTKAPHGRTVFFPFYHLFVQQKASALLLSVWRRFWEEPRGAHAV